MSTGTALLNGGMDVTPSTNGGPYYTPADPGHGHVTISKEDTVTDENSDKKVFCKCTCLKACSNAIVSGLETLFYRQVHCTCIYM